VLTRRDFLKGVSLLPLARLVPLPVWDRAAAAAEETFAFFTPHQAAVVREATARIIPGPTDDPLEMGHPGAREANVTRFIDVLLSALDHHPEHIYGGGPFGAPATQWVALSVQQRRGWEQRIATLKKAYRDGVTLLDSLAGGDFTTASAMDKDQYLMSDQAAAFLDVLYTHAIEGTYSDPMYGGNANRSGWTEIKFPGPSMPRGYTRAEVSQSDGLDVIDPTGVVGQVLDALEGMGQA
jgi:gluconate 2-dehydrogenase gamma chain